MLQSTQVQFVSPFNTPIYSTLIKDRVYFTYTSQELKALEVLEATRPTALRSFDQIPMRGSDLLLQVKLMIPFLAGKSVIFVGDNDGTSLLLGLLATQGHFHPSHMTILDFDERILTAFSNVAKERGFEHLLDFHLYNVFDKTPRDLFGKYDWFYTNPPYGSRNKGESARLFITRGIECVKPSGEGCVILPNDTTRLWSEDAMLKTQKFLTNENWLVRNGLTDIHQYYLDDDKELASSLLLIKNVAALSNVDTSNPYTSKRVEPSSIPHFYGATVSLPYPHYISANNSENFNWREELE